MYPSKGVLLIAQYSAAPFALPDASRAALREAEVLTWNRSAVAAKNTDMVATSRACVGYKWIEAMRRRGYQGAFELAATVDYLWIRGCCTRYGRCTWRRRGL